MPGQDQGAALVGLVGPGSVHQPRVGDDQVAGFEWDVDSVVAVHKDRMAEVVDGLDLGAVGVGQDVVEVDAFAVGARYYAQAAVFAIGVGHVIGKEDPCWPGRGGLGVVPVSEVLVPVERRAVGGFGQQDGDVVGTHVFEAEFGADLHLRWVVDEPCDDGGGKGAFILSMIGLRPAPRGPDVDVAALVAEFGIYGHPVENVGRPGAELAEQRVLQQTGDDGIAEFDEFVALGAGGGCGEDAFHVVSPLVY